MPHRRLRAILLCLAACAVPAGLPAAAPAATPAKAITLVATATVPGFAEPQRYPLKIDPYDAATVRVVSRPDAATVVLVDRPTKLVRRHGKDVRIAVPPCVKGTLGVLLLPGPSDPLAVVRRLLPVAQQEGLVQESPNGKLLDAASTGGLAYRAAFEITKGEGAPTRFVRSVSASRWAPGPAAAVVVERMEVTRLRTDGRCRADGDSLTSTDPLLRLWMLGTQDLGSDAEEGA